LIVDIAIGAPFEKGLRDNSESYGAVYIFYGKSGISNDWNYGLRLSSGDYSPIPLQGFGISFSSPLDIDGNGTPGTVLTSGFTFQ
jgi:hypothetical protein